MPKRRTLVEVCLGEPPPGRDGADPRRTRDEPHPDRGTSGSTREPPGSGGGRGGFLGAGSSAARCSAFLLHQRAAPLSRRAHCSATRPGREPRRHHPSRRIWIYPGCDSQKAAAAARISSDLQQTNRPARPWPCRTPWTAESCPGC